MKTWRERIAEARVRGRFNDSDRRAWADGNTCLVGEQRERYGLNFNLEMTRIGPNVDSYELQTSILIALDDNNFDEVERLLEHIEDRALELKREMLPSCLAPWCE